MKLQTKLQLFLGVLFSLSLAIAISLKSITGKIDNAASWIEHTHSVITQANSLIKSVVDMETGLRGFLLTGDEVFLEPYQEANQRWSQDLEKLKKTVSDNPPQAGKLEGINKTLEFWKKTVVKRTVAFKKSKKEKALLNFIKEQNGKVAIDNIRAQVSEFIQVEDALMVKRKIAYQENLFNLVIMIILGIGLLCLVGIGFGFYHSRELKLGFKTIEENMRTLEEGEFSKIPTSHKNKDEFMRVYNLLTAWLKKSSSLINNPWNLQNLPPSGAWQLV